MGSALVFKLCSFLPLLRSCSASIAQPLSDWMYGTWLQRMGHNELENLHKGSAGTPVLKDSGCQKFWSQPNKFPSQAEVHFLSEV